MERISSEKLQQIDNKADIDRLRDMSNTELVSFFYSPELLVGENRQVLEMAYDVLMEREFNMVEIENEQAY